MTEVIFKINKSVFLKIVIKRVTLASKKCSEILKALDGFKSK